MSKTCIKCTQLCPGCEFRHWPWNWPCPCVVAQRRHKHSGDTSLARAEHAGMAAQDGLQVASQLAADSWSH